MVLANGEQVVIDFQDALQGPRQYDLVALLRDSYVELDRPLIDAMLARYLKAFEAEGGQPLEASDFVGFFDLLTVRSEEHTSELQSQSNLVCRLLLEKKKKNYCMAQCCRGIM